MTSFRARDHYYQRFRSVDRPARGPADGLLEEIQNEVLARHPDWQQRIRLIEDVPVSTRPVGSWWRGRMRRRKRARND